MKKKYNKTVNATFLDLINLSVSGNPKSKIKKKGKSIAAKKQGKKKS